MLETMVQCTMVEPRTFWSCTMHDALPCLQHWLTWNTKGFTISAVVLFGCVGCMGQENVNTGTS